MRLSTIWTVTVALLVDLSAQQTSEDPVVDFCRRWQHHTCIVDSKLYIDGGVVAYDGSFDNDTTQPSSRNLSSMTSPF